MKLPYNASGESLVARQSRDLVLPFNPENPYIAAQRFLENNELPLSYLDEVVRFIEKNTAGATLGSSGEQFADPYTGTLPEVRPISCTNSLCIRCLEVPGLASNDIHGSVRLPGPLHR